MSACESALIANKAAVGADQQTYHDVLFSSFEAMHERLQNFFGVSVSFRRQLIIFFLASNLSRRREEEHSPVDNSCFGFDRRNQHLKTILPLFSTTHNHATDF